MTSPYRAQFDWIVVKPTWLMFLYWAGVSFYNRAWSTAMFDVAMMFVLGFVGGRVHSSQ